MITIEKQATNSQTMILSITGRMYAEQATTFRKQVLSLIEKGLTELKLNLSSLEYIDSSGLGVLISIRKHLDKVGGTLTILGIQGDVQELFELTRLNQVFHIE